MWCEIAQNKTKQNSLSCKYQYIKAMLVWESFVMRKYVMRVECRFYLNVKVDGTDSQHCALKG